jgi:hypothetical protein
VSVWDGSAYSLVENLFDGTSVDGVALAQTGKITFDSTVGTAKVRETSGMIAYVYRVSFSGIDSGVSVYYCTLDAPMQPVTDIWDGTDRTVAAFYIPRDDTYNDYTLNVYENTYDSTDSAPKRN